MTKKNAKKSGPWYGSRENALALAVLALCFAGIAAIMLCGVPGSAPVQKTVEPNEPVRSEVWERLSVAPIVEKVRDSVVHIEKVGECQGSGCIISPDGIIFTAKHVTDGTHADYTVTMDDGTKHKVKYVFEDDDNDVAFMKLDLPKGHPPLPYSNLSDYDLMRVGDPLLIFGSPLGYDNFNTVSEGILSAAQRDLVDVSGGARECVAYDWYVLFQSNSAAYPGNSGGPVFNLNGDVIGVLVAGMDSHLNYSVPVARFRDTIDTVRQGFALQRFSPVTEESTRLAQLERRVEMAELGLELTFILMEDLVSEQQIWEALVELLRRHPNEFLYNLPGHEMLYQDPMVAPPSSKAEKLDAVKGILDTDKPYWGVGQYKVRK